MVERLFAAYFAEGRDLNNIDQLVELAAEVGLPATDARTLLVSTAGIADVQASQDQAQSLGIQGVPFYVFDARYALSGAQPVETFVQALDMLQRELAGQV